MRTEAEWLQIFDEAEKAPMTQKRWCANKGIPYKTYLSRKSRYKKKIRLSKGIMPEAVFLSKCETCLSFIDDFQGGLIHMYPHPVPGIGKETLLGIIRQEMGRDACNGERYLFLSPDQKTLCSLKWTGNGFCYAKAHREKGRIAWPFEGKAFSEQDRIHLLQMLR